MNLAGWSLTNQAVVPSPVGGGKSLAFSSADGDFASATINVSETTYAATSGPLADPEFDGWCNLLE